MDVLVDSTKERLLMKRALRLLGFCFLSLVAVVALAGALFGCFIYSPAPALPRLSGTSAKGSIEVDGLNSGRFLDPPEFTVFHDKGNEVNAFDRIEQDLDVRFDRKLARRDRAPEELASIRAAVLHPMLPVRGAGLLVEHPFGHNPDQ